MPSLPLRSALGARSLGAFSERHARKLPVAAAAVFAVLAGHALARLAWTLVPMPEAARWQAPPAPALPPRPGDAVDVNALASSGLFGRLQVAAGNALMAAPETPLNLVLLGLLADDRPERSRALISAAPGDEQAYAVGDDLGHGVTLQAIFPDRVILLRNGRPETLRLERDKGGAPGAPAPALAAADDAAPAGPSPPLSQIRDEVVRDPAKAAEYIRVQPANVAGQLKGYRIYPGRDRGVFSSAGLRPGDLVTAVNGVQLDDPAKALQLLGDLGQAGTVNLVVERGGQSQNISINLSN